MGNEGVIDRSVGALLGLATGDAVGTALEFKPPGSFTPIDDLVGGGPFELEAGQWTDDTSMALCLAESLLDIGGHDPIDQLRRYVQWYRDGYFSPKGWCFDIGGTTRKQLERFERSGEPIDPEVDQYAAANGSLMRLAGVPIRWHTSVQEAAEWSARSSMTTHPARMPVDACRVLGAMTAALIQGRPADEVLSGDFWQFGPLDDQVVAVAAGSWMRKEPPEIRGKGFCIDALEAALWAVDGATDFADAVLRAANLGDDADTTAAIAGQLAGARWGASGIRADWLEKVTEAGRIASLARNLAIAGGAPPRLAISGLPVWEDEERVHAWWVQPGRVLAGEYPGDRDDVAKARAKIAVLVDHGVRTFVDLTASADGLTPYDGVLAEAAAARGLDLRRLACPIPDVSVIDDDDYEPIIALIDEAATRGAVYVHCWGGVGRTGTVVGCLLVDEGLDGDAALQRIAELRASTGKAHRRAPETPDQNAVILRRAQRAR